MNARTDAHPIWSVLEHQGRMLVWLAERTGYSENLVLAVKSGRRRASADFRAKCAQALDLPESLLFALESPAEAVAPAS